MATVNEAGSYPGMLVLWDEKHACVRGENEDGHSRICDRINRPIVLIIKVAARCKRVQISWGDASYLSKGRTVSTKSMRGLDLNFSWGGRIAALYSVRGKTLGG